MGCFGRLRETGMVLGLWILGAACATVAPPAPASFVLNRVVLPPGFDDVETVEAAVFLAGRQTGIAWGPGDPSVPSYDLVLSLLDSSATLEVWSRGAVPDLVYRVEYAFGDDVFSSDDTLLSVLRRAFQRLRAGLETPG